MSETVSPIQNTRLTWGHLTPWSFEAIGQELGTVVSTTPTSVAWTTANKAVYVPFMLAQGFVVKKAGWINGGTVSASNHADAAIYKDDGATGGPGTRVVSAGSTAQGTASVIQEVDITDTYIAPGSYFMAFACDNTAATFFTAALTAPRIQAFGCLTQASLTAAALPNPATPVKDTTWTSIPVFGFSGTTVLA